MAKNLEEIAKLLKHTKFKRKWFGGIDEEDVWKKLGRLQSEYSELIEENSRKHDALVNQWQEYAASLEKQLQERRESPQLPPVNPKVYSKSPINSTENQKYGRG
ncbi:protein of unknown function [Ruminococcaceae bacterium BL-4]|nr:protein of unknown function [Ruminococcaceae bacterium BL-4]